MALKKGDTVKAPWRIYGDDQNLTGVVTGISNARGKYQVRVRWNGDGDVTPAGDESLFIDSQAHGLEVVALYAGQANDAQPR